MIEDVKPASAGHRTQRVKPSALVVLGMHRSGTSAMARVCSLLGARLPRTLLGSGRGNELGHWESARLVALNDSLLQAANSSWDDWRRFPLEALPSDASANFRALLKQALEEEYGGGTLFVLKDPRICRFANLYADTFAEVGIEARYVIPIRNPLAVAASLHERDGISDAFAGLLWLRHVLDAEAFTRNAPRAIVSYERLLSDWREVSSIVASRTGLSLNITEHAAEQIDAFLSRSHQHYAPSLNEMEARPDLPRWLKDAYLALRAIEADPDALDSLRILDQIASTFEAASGAFGPALFGELAARDRAAQRQRDRLEQEHRSKTEAADQEWQVKIGEAIERERSRAHENGELREKTILRFGERLGEQAIEIARLRFELQALDEQLHAANADRQVLAAEVERLCGPNAVGMSRIALEAELLDSRQQLAQVSEDLAVLQRRLVEAIDAHARAEQSRAELAVACARLSTEIAESIRSASKQEREAEAQRRDFESRIVAAVEEGAAYEVQLKVLEEKLAEALRSNEELNKEVVAQGQALLSVSSLDVLTASADASQGRDVACLLPEPDEVDLSVVIPCFNQGQFIVEELTLLAQEAGFTREVIIVDDGSTEGRTARALQEAGRRPEVKIIQQANQGLSAARNAGLRAARGHYVILLDADDVLAPGIADRLVQAERSGADVTIFDYLISNEFMTYFERPSPYTISSDALSLDSFMHRWERGLSVPIHCAVFRRSKIRALFDPRLRAKEDWAFWIANARLGMTLAYVPTLQAIYRQTASNMTKNKGSMMASWIVAAHVLCEQMDEGRERFLQASMQHVQNYYIPVMEWRVRYASARSVLGRAAQRFLLLRSESRNFADLLLRLGRDARRWSLRLRAAMAQARVAAGRRVSGAPLHLARKINFATLRRTPKRDATFSIIVPVYNHAEHLNQCFTSLTNQTVKPYEIIAVDDKSTDNAVREIMAAYEHGNPGLFRGLYNEINLGISASLNRAIDVATGQWLVLVDCDDYLDKDALLYLTRAIHKRERVGYVFSDRRRIDEVRGRVGVDVFGGRPDLLNVSFPAALRTSMVASHLKAIRRDVHYTVGGYDSSLDGVQDWDFALRALAKGVEFTYVPKAIYNYRWHRNSVSLSASTSQWRLANRVRSQTMFGERRIDWSPADVEAALDRYQRAWYDGGRLMQLAEGEALPARAQRLLLDIGGLKDLAWIERVRCGGFGGAVIGRIIAPYNPELAGELRMISGFFDRLLTSDPLWVVALSPVAPAPDQVTFRQGANYERRQRGI